MTVPRIIFICVCVSIAIGAWLIAARTSRNTPTSPSFKPSASEVVMTDMPIVPYYEARYEQSYDDWWTAQNIVQFGATTTNIAIETSGSTPGPAEFDLLRRVYDQEDEINSEVASALFAEYQKVRSAELERIAAELDKETAEMILPIINSEDEAWRIGAYSVIEMPIQHDDKFRFRIRLLCNWDDEYGLQMRYIDGKSQGIERGEY